MAKNEDALVLDNYFKKKKKFKASKNRV